MHMSRILQMYHVIKFFPSDPNGPQTLLNGIMVELEVNLHTETYPSIKLDAMCKIQHLLKIAKSKFCCRPSHCLWLFQIHVRGQNQHSYGENKIIMLLFHFSPSQHQACFKSHANLNKTSTISLQNHPHTFPINRWRFSTAQSRWKRPQTHSKHLWWTSIKRVPGFHFQSTSTPNNSLETFTTHHSSFPNT